MNWLFYTKSNGDISSMPNNPALDTDAQKRAFLGDDGANNFEIISNDDLLRHPTWDGEKYISGIGSKQEERDWRDTELLKTDWAILPDSPLSPEEHNAYVVYRQFLRDWPQKVNFPDSTQRPKL